MSLVAITKNVNLVYYGGFSVGMLVGASTMFGEESPIMMNYWKMSKFGTGAKQVINWAFRLVPMITLPWLLGPTLGCPDKTYLQQSLLVSGLVSILNVQALLGGLAESVDNMFLWKMNMVNQLSLGALTYAAYKQATK